MDNLSMQEANQTSPGMTKMIRREVFSDIVQATSAVDKSHYESCVQWLLTTYRASGFDCHK